MLATNFKTAEELKLIPEAYVALQRVLRMLEDGTLVHTQTTRPIKNGFNMNTLMDRSECGAVGCIGGWALTFMEGTRFTEFSHGPEAEAIAQLFYPKTRACLKTTIDWGWGWSSFTVDEAAHALRTYLVTGTPEWT
jgi:hypothetical protein